MQELIGVLSSPAFFGFLGTVATAIFLYKGKTREHATDPQELLLKQIEALDSRVSSQDTRISAQEAKIDELNRKLDEMWDSMIHARRWIVKLEDTITGLDHDPPERPAEIQKLFDD